MKDPRTLNILDYTYTLPEERIAAFPLAERDASKLLIYDKGRITEDTYRNIAQHIPNDSLLVFNNTKVVEARLLFQKPTGGQVEIFCLEPHEQYTDITSAMLQTGKVYWHCLVGGASKWKPGQLLEKHIQSGKEEILLRASYIEKRRESFIIELSWTPASLSFAELLHKAGAIPLPPYIKRKAEQSDSERYQTVYARQDGSVAAPTAGLHFTDSVFQSFAEKNIATEFLTLHVGAGTFKPVKAERMEGHEMHAEWMDVSAAAIKNLLANLDGRIVAVGTTSLRTIESLYWMGRKAASHEPTFANAMAGKLRAASREPQRDILEINQWEVYELANSDIPAREALEALLRWMEERKLDRLLTRTQILIAPGYRFRIVKGLITNFHQPQSTLLLLVAALIGDDWRKVYAYALENGFRFLSYGDGGLLWGNNIYTADKKHITSGPAA
ncbi:MAG: S-adenosylmethionine:tRNA ribosyltransferase-isomerase [Sphingobacteriales bacterium]|nr:S-adenosylmethionine:tRNA ribosyltransferase-isomerase [Sphingobacteriales bacterium]